MFWNMIYRAEGHGIRLDALFEEILEGTHTSKLSLETGKPASDQAPIVDRTVSPLVSRSCVNSDRESAWLIDAFQPTDTARTYHVPAVRPWQRDLLDDGRQGRRGIAHATDEPLLLLLASRRTDPGRRESAAPGLGAGHRPCRLQPTVRLVIRQGRLRLRLRLPG